VYSVYELIASRTHRLHTLHNMETMKNSVTHTNTHTHTYTLIFLRTFAHFTTERFCSLETYEMANVYSSDTKCKAAVDRARDHCQQLT